MIGISIQCRALLLSGVLAVLLAGQVATVEAQQCGSVSINVTRYGPLVLECKGTFVRWRYYRYLGSPSIFHTEPNADRLQSSWLVIENVTTSASSASIQCSRSQCSTWYNIKVFVPPSNVNITDSGLTANTVRFRDTAILTCSAAGTAPLQYAWYYKASYQEYRTPLPGANSTSYTVYSAKFSNVGEYTCEVSNWAGKSSETYTLHVQAPPSDVRITDSGLTSNTLELGTSTTLRCSASGTAPFVYQWSHNNIIILAATSSTYRVTSAEFSDVGQYTCEVSNLVGNDRGSYTLNVQAPPSDVRITDSRLTSNTVQLGISTTLRCSASGTASQYKWKHNGTFIPAATSSTYRVTSVEFSDAGRYTCEVSNWVGNDNDSYTLNVQAHPSPVKITDSGLNSATIGLGASTRLSCSSPATSPQYQWSHNGSNISGAISSWYTVGSANFNDAGRYTCLVSNLVGTDYGSYQLQVQAPPSDVRITDSGLTSNTAQRGTTTTLTCSASGPAPFVYQWRHNSTIILAATSSTYRVTFAEFSDAGRYTCTVSNLVGNDRGLYTLNVQAHPSPVTITDSGLNSATIGLGASTRLSCSSRATSPQYQWSHNGSNISNAISSWYTISSANYNDAGRYTCLVSNLVGTDHGSYQLQVQAPPSDVRITDSGLTSNTVQLGTSTTLRCSASGPAPFVYQWSHNGIIPAATSSTYRISSVEFSDAGRYTCQVSNLVGNDRGSYTLNVQAHPSPVTITDSGLNSRTIRLGASTRLSCSSPATSPQYQWSHNGSNISSAISSWYTVSSANFNDAGTYTCLVSNLVGTDYGSYQLQVQAQPTIEGMNTSSSNNKIILRRGVSSSVTMFCTANQDAGSVTFEWTLNGGTAPGSPQSIINHVVGRLFISSVTLAHGGTYRCSTRNLVGNDHQELLFTVVDPPRVEAIRVNGSIVSTIFALKGTTSRFSCVAGGTSPLTTSWELQTMRGKTNRVGSTFSSILTQEDEGSYTCVVVNGQEGLSDNATVTVRVYDPITLTSDAMTELEHNENDQVTLRCLFFKDQDDPDHFPQVAWNGPGFDRTQSASQTIPNNYESTFTFTATRLHHGQFNCSVNDVGVGTISATFQLTVYYPPTDVALRSTPASVNNGSSTTINCTGHSRPPPEFSITRRLTNGKKSTSSGGTFLLQPTSREELGDNLLTCSATNSKYSTPVFSATRTILVKGAPDAVDSNSIHVTSRSFTSVSVQWTTPQNNYDAIRYYQFQLGECVTSDQTGSECQPVYTQYRSRSTSLSYTLKRLKPFKTYTLKIVAYNNVGPGPFSNAVAFQTVQQDEATVRNFTASLQGDTAVLFQWYADVNLTQDGTAFSYFRLTLLRQGFPEVVNANLSLGDAQCSNSSMTEFCHEWEGFAAGVRYSVWIEMVYSYPATGGRVDLTVTIPSASASAPLVAAVVGGAGGGLLTAVLALVALVIIPVIVVVLHCRRKSRVKKPEKNPEGEEDETNCSSTARSSDYRYEANIAAKSNVSTEIEESATQLDQARATITPTVNTINPYQPLDVEGVADCNAYTSYNFGQPANPKGDDEPEYAMVDIAGGACRKDDCKISSSRGGGVRNQNSDSHLDPDYAVPSEAMSEYAADENIYMEPDIDIVQDTTKVEVVCESTKSAATTGAHPPNSGKKKKALLPMANKKQTSPSTSPKPKQPTAAGTNAATSMTADLQQGPPQVSEAPAPTSTSPRPQCPEHPVASVTSPLQQNAPQVSEAPAQRTLPKPQYPKQKPAADTNAAAKMTPASSLQRCDSKASERQSTKPQPKPKGQGMDPPAPGLRRSVSPASSLHRCDYKASERQSTKPQPKPKGQNMDPPTPGLRRSVSAAKPPQREVPVQQGVGPPSSVADRRCMQPSHGGDTKVDSTVKLRDSSAGPTPPQVAPKGTPAKPKCKPRPTAAQASQVTVSPVEASPVRSEGIRKTPPTPAVRQAHLPPATPAGQLQTTGNPQSGPTAGKLSVAERAKLLEKMM